MQLSGTLTLNRVSEGEAFLDELAERTTTVDRGRWAVVVVYAISFLIIGVLFVDGFSYYTTPVDMRPHHEDYRVLRPAGTRGIAYGITGTAMMVLMMLYSLRKRLKVMRNLFRVPIWLNAHIYLGIMGPLFILLHTSFKINGLVAIAFWSMVIVSISGFVGRYLYRFIPRGIHGNELTLRELNDMYSALNEQLRAEFSLPDAAVGRLHEMAQLPVHGNSLPGTLAALVMARLRRQRLLRETIGEICREFDVPHINVRPLTVLARTQWRLQSRVQALEHVRRLFHYWHVAHKPLAVLMYLIVVVHIGVAVWTGYAVM